MRKLIVSEFVTLDGVVEGPEKWNGPFWNEEIAAFKHDELFAAGALLLGRVTYEGFAAAWPGRTDEGDGYTDRINAIPKLVVSTTLKDAAWHNSTIIKDNVAAALTRLKAEPGEDILIFGSGRLVNALIQQGLVDRYNLLVFPVVLGAGRRLIADGTAAGLQLVETRAFSSGVVALIYQPAGEAGAGSSPGERA